jgi:hypothetical protein
MESVEGIIKGLFFIVVIIISIPNFIFAGGGQHYPNGLEAEVIGVLPPEGLYYRQFNIFYTADKLKDDRGHTLTLEKNGVEPCILETEIEPVDCRMNSRWRKCDTR